MKITLKDGSCKEYQQPMSVYDIAADLSEGLARVATAGEMNGEIVDLRTVIDQDCALNILTFNDEKGKGAFRHIIYAENSLCFCNDYYLFNFHSAPSLVSLISNPISESLLRIKSAVCQSL